MVFFSESFKTFVKIRKSVRVLINHFHGCKDIDMGTLAYNGSSESRTTVSPALRERVKSGPSVRGEDRKCQILE